MMRVCTHTGHSAPDTRSGVASRGSSVAHPPNNKKGNRAHRWGALMARQRKWRRDGVRSVVVVLRCSAVVPVAPGERGGDEVQSKEEETIAQAELTEGGGKNDRLRFWQS
jgi:hypothetical protein